LLRSAMTRLYAEVMRSISHYCAQQKGNTPQRLFLCGGTASAPCLREFFREKLGVPVEFFNPLRNVVVAPTMPVEELSHSGHLLGELVGLALRSVTECPMSLNLRPAVVARRHELEKRRPFLAAAAAVIILALLSWSFFYARAVQVMRHGAERVREINRPMRAVEQKIDKLRQEAASLDIVTVALIGAIHDRFFWLEILEDLNERLPKQDIWITELVPTSEGKPVGLEDKHLLDNAPAQAPATPTGKNPAAQPMIDGMLLRGLYLYNPKQQEIVVEYFRNLAGSPFFSVDSKNETRAIKSTIPNNTEWAFPYELRLDLNKPIKLP